MRLANCWVDNYRGCLYGGLTVHSERDPGYTFAPADTIYQIARTHHLMSNLDKARIHYGDALRIYQFINNQRGIAACQYGLGRLMILILFIDEALERLNQACHIYDTIEDKQRADDVREIIKLITKAKEGEKQIA